LKIFNKKNARASIKWLATSLMATGLAVGLSTTVYGQARGELTDNINVYACSQTREVLFTANRGRNVELLERVGDFYRANIQDNHDVYILGDFVRVTEATGVIRRQLVNIYEIPGEDYAIGFRREGETVQVTGLYGNWFEVQFEGGRGFIRDGYMRVSMADKLPVTPVSPHRAGLAAEVVAYAKQYLGVPYRWGSMDASRGFDCSGFVITVMRNFGVSLQRISRDMAAINGTYVSRSNLQAGDLVFFATMGGRRISHVGIYIGDGRFIHSATNGGVIISGMSESYYASRYVTARRVL